MKTKRPTRFWISIGIIIVFTIVGGGVAAHYFSGGSKEAGIAGITLIAIAVLFVFVAIAQRNLRKDPMVGIPDFKS